MHISLTLSPLLLDPFLCLTPTRPTKKFPLPSFPFSGGSGKKVVSLSSSVQISISCSNSAFDVFKSSFFPSPPPIRSLFPPLFHPYLAVRPSSPRREESSFPSFTPFVPRQHTRTHHHHHQAIRPRNLTPLPPPPPEISRCLERKGGRYQRRPVPDVVCTQQDVPFLCGRGGKKCSVQRSFHAPLVNPASVLLSGSQSL